MQSIQVQYVITCKAASRHYMSVELALHVSHAHYETLTGVLTGVLPGVLKGVPNGPLNGMLTGLLTILHCGLWY